MLAAPERGTHDFTSILCECPAWFAAQKTPSQTETTRVITSSSDKLQQAEEEEMNEELLNGSFQLLITAQARRVWDFFSLHTDLLHLAGRSEFVEVDSGIPFCHH